MTKLKASVMGIADALLYHENHAIVAWFKRGYTGKEKTNKKIT